MTRYVIRQQKIPVYFKNHGDVHWTTNIDDAETFASTGDAEHMAEIGVGLSVADYVVLPVEVTIAYSRYLELFPYADPRD